VRLLIIIIIIIIVVVSYGLRPVETCYGYYKIELKLKKPNSVAVVRKRTTPTERPQLVGEVVPTFAGRGCCVVSATNYHGR
jgi:hypothetical protein